MRKMKQRNIFCPYCHSESKYYISQTDINRKVSKIKYILYQCNSCELIFLINPPEKIEKYYTSDYHYIPKTAEELESYLPQEQFKIELITPYKNKGTLLEIGPSMGVFCRLAQKVGFDVSAIELDKKCVNYLNNKLGVRAIQSNNPIAILKNDKKKYDAIVLWHSIEHMQKPFNLIEEIVNSLSSEGILVVAAPNPMSWQAKRMGKYWPHYDLPRHIFELPISWIMKFAKENRLEPVLVTTKDEGSLYWNRFSWAMLLRHLCIFKSQKERFWKTCLKFAKIFSKWEDVEGQGACYTIILKKNKNIHTG